MSYPRTCFKLASLLLVALMGAAGCGNPHPGAVATPPLVVMVATPLKVDGRLPEVSDYQVFTARTQAIQSVDIKPRVTGFLVKICFKDGDSVKKDQVLFEIDDRIYKAKWDMAVADLEVRKASLVKTQAEYDIGLRVQKEQKGAISEQELTKRLGSRDEAKGGVDLAKAQLDYAKDYYDWCKVRSPLDGRTNRHLIDEGNLVTQDMSLLTNIVSLEQLWAYFDVDENTANMYQDLVKKGVVKSARANQIPVSMNVGEGKDRVTLQGYIDFLSNQLDPNTGSIRLRAFFENADGKLAGMFGRVRVPIGPEHQALLVVDAAIGTDQGSRFVYVVNEQNVVEYRAVDVGQLHDGLREVYGTRTIKEPGPDGKDIDKKVEVLKPTDRIIVEGLQRVRPGAKVEPQLVDMKTLLVKYGESPVAAPPTPAKKK